MSGYAGSWTSDTSSVESGFEVFAIATAVFARRFAVSADKSGEDANPHAPFTITRTPIPIIVSSLWVSGFASRSESTPVLVRSTRTSTCDAPSDLAVEIAASVKWESGRARKSASTVLLTVAPYSFF